MSLLRLFLLSLAGLLPLSSPASGADSLPPQDKAQKPLLERPIEGLSRDRLILPGVKVQPNEYLSYAIYYWPDPKNPQSPYLCIDGKKNQDLINRGDLPRLSQMLSTVCKLAGQYAKTGDTRYSKRAGEWLRHWFLDKETRMLPHLKYSQIRPGHNTSGQGGGIIDLSNLPHFLASVSLLDRSEALTPAEWQAFDQWLRDYDHWLETSPEGQYESRSKNNHYLYYMAQRAAIAARLGEKNALKTHLNNAFSQMDKHINPDGSQPLELRRAKGLSYSLYSLRAWFLLAGLGESLETNYWAYTSPGGASLEKALTFLQQLAGERKNTSPDAAPEVPDKALQEMDSQLSRKKTDSSKR